MLSTNIRPGFTLAITAFTSNCPFHLLNGYIYKNHPCLIQKSYVIPLKLLYSNFTTMTEYSLFVLIVVLNQSR